MILDCVILHNVLAGEIREASNAAKRSSREIVRKFQDGRYLAEKARIALTSLCISIKAILTASLEMRKRGFSFVSDTVAVGHPAIHSLRLVGCGGR